MSRRALAIAFGAAGALLVLWFLALWGPQGGKLSDADARVSAAETANEALQIRLQRLQGVQDRATELTAELAELQRAVPDEPSLAQFILDANQAATDSGVDFLSIAPGVPDQPDPSVPATMTLSINVQGGYFEVLDYLDRFATMPRVVVIDAITMTPSESESGGTGLVVALTGRMFATTAPAVAVTGETPTTTVPGEANEQVTTSTQAAPEITVSANG